MVIEIICRSEDHPDKTAKITAFDRVDGEWREVGYPGVRLARPSINDITVTPDGDGDVSYSPDWEIVRYWQRQLDAFEGTGRPSPGGGIKYEWECPHLRCKAKARKRHDKLVPMLDAAEGARLSNIPLSMLRN